MNLLQKLCGPKQPGVETTFHELDYSNFENHYFIDSLNKDSLTSEVQRTIAKTLSYENSGIIDEEETEFTQIDKHTGLLKLVTECKYGYDRPDVLSCLLLRIDDEQTVHKLKTYELVTTNWEEIKNNQKKLRNYTAKKVGDSRIKDDCQVRWPTYYSFGATSVPDNLDRISVIKVEAGNVLRENYYDCGSKLHGVANYISKAYVIDPAKL